MTEIERLGDLLKLDYYEIKERFPRGETDSLTSKALELAGDLVGDLLSGTWFGDTELKYKMLNDYLGKEVQADDLVTLQASFGDAEVEAMRKDFNRNIL